MSDITAKKLLKSIEDMNKVLGKQQSFRVKKKDNSDSKILFKIKLIIGRGTFGVVSLIETNNLRLALKTVYQDRRYCNRELSILQKISHKNIISLEFFYYTSITDEGWYLNMIFEYAPYCLEILVKNKKHSINFIKDLYKQAISALDYLHSLKICHRDIKPANILINENNILKICDFGCAKYIADDSPNISYICSRYYRAPENLFGLTRYSFGIDIWAFALVFCEFRYTTPLFMGENTQDVLSAIFSRINNMDHIDINSLYLDNRNEKNFFDFLFTLFNDNVLSSVLFKSLIINPDKRATAKTILSIVDK